MPSPLNRNLISVLSVIVSIILTTSFQLNGQIKTETFKFYNISIKNGLSQSSANCIFQDSRGIMWIGTEDGLNKYDGYTFKIYKPSQDDLFSISNSRILAVKEDKNGNLWIGTNGGGLNNYDRKSDRFYKVAGEGTEGVTVVNSVLIHDTHLWVGTNKGIMLVEPESGRYFKVTETYPRLKSIDQLPVTTLTSKGNLIFIGTPAGLFRYNIDLNELNQYPEFVTKNGSGITALLADRNNNLLIGTETHFYRMDIESGIIEEVILPGLSNAVKAILEDYSGKLWIATFGSGLYIGTLESGKFENLTYDHLNPYSIRNNEVLSLYMDYSGLIWAGTNGIDIYNPLREKFILYDYVPYSRERLVFRNIHPIYQDTEEVLWIGSKTDGVHVLDRANQKYFRLSQASGLSSNRIRAIKEFPEGVLWIGTEDAGFDIVLLNAERKPAKVKNYRTSDNPNSVNSNTIYSFFPDDKGNMWIGTDNGLAIMDIQAETFTRYLPDSTNVNSISNSTVYSIFGDRSQNIWLATDLGINKFDTISGGFRHFIHDDGNENSIIHNEILCFHEDRSGNLWIGTYGKGFDKYDPVSNTFTHFSEIKGISTAVIYGILEDYEGYLWMSSNNGVLKFNPKTREIKQFDIEDGLQSNEFNGNSYYINSSGEMFFGGQFGFNSFYPDQVKVDTSIPGIVIADLVVHNASVVPGEKSPLKEHINIAKSIDLNFRQNNFTLYFSALHYGNPSRNKYLYKLEGFDKEWVEAGTKRFVSYTNLPYKTYTFRIKASNSDGIWNEDGISVKIRVRPPFWGTTIFRILAGLIIAGGIVYLVKRRLTYDERQKKIIEDKLNAASKELDEAKNQLEIQRSEIVVQKRELVTRQKDQENLLWFNQGLGIFSEIISKNREDVPKLCKEFIEKLTEYVEAQQGGVFLYNNDDVSEPFLEQIASYAFAASRHNQRFSPGEGYVGVCFRDKKFVEIDNLPENYSIFGSGLGRMPVKHLVLAPLVVVNDCIGVVELGSFKKIKGYKITFIEKLVENFASTILTAQANLRMKILIEQTQKQAQELSESEEIVRKNLEELLASQEESSRREDELIKQAEEAATREEMLNNEIELLRKQLKDPEQQSTSSQTSGFIS